MRFFTDEFFTKEQKVEMLGSKYEAHEKEQQREQQINAERKARWADLESTRRLELHNQQGKNNVHIGWFALAFIMLCAALTGGWLRYPA